MCAWIMKTNGVKIFACYTMVMFLCVFGMSAFFGKKAETAQPEPVETTAAEPEPEPDLPTPDPPDADNTWAVMLINRDNPLPQDYCDNVETSLVYKSTRSFFMDSRVESYVKDMFDAAEADGIELVMVSAYRTIAYQENNFNESVRERMEQRGMTEEEAIADTTLEVAPPGASEHNSGLAADIMTEGMVDMTDDSFKDTEAYEWLRKHCADYGFIVRYPQGKESITGYKFEPWHYRFVGKYYARLIMDNNITLEELYEKMKWIDEDGKAIYHLPDTGDDKFTLISGSYDTDEASDTAADEETDGETDKADGETSDTDDPDGSATE